MNIKNHKTFGNSIKMMFSKGENNMKNKNVGADVSSKLETKLKRIIQKRRNKQVKVDKIPHKEMYDRMVKEAFLVISKSWESSAECKPALDTGIELVSYPFFIVERTLRLYSDAAYTVNPDTGKSCFYDSFAFESVDEFDKYIDDVMKLLPKGTEVVTKRYDTEYTTVCNDGAEVHVSFKIKIE